MNETAQGVACRTLTTPGAPCGAYQRQKTVADDGAACSAACSPLAVEHPQPRNTAVRDYAPARCKESARYISSQLNPPATKAKMDRKRRLPLIQPRLLDQRHTNNAQRLCHCSAVLMKCPLAQQ